VEVADRAKPGEYQFVVLLHTMPAHAERPTHWDFMIDLGEKLLTFELRELPNKPVAGEGQRLSMLRLKDHRRDYLQYQGELSGDPASGKARGSVQRVAAGWLHGVDQVSTARGDAPQRYLLRAAELQADLEFSLCAVGHITQLIIHHWQWLEGQ
jgi:hypothetical protein